MGFSNFELDRGDPFFVFIFVFLILPSMNLFINAFKDGQGNFTLANINFLSNPYVLKLMPPVCRSVSSLPWLAVFLVFIVAFAITIGNAPRWMRLVLMTFSGLAANFGGVPLAFAFIATLGRTGFITAILKNICYTDSSGIQNLPINPYNHGFNLYSLTGAGFNLYLLHISPHGVDYYPGA